MPGEVQLALSIMPAVVAMQSTPGSMYHCPDGTQMFPPDYSEAENVSNENNFSMYSGLRMLEFLLANNTLHADGVLLDFKTDVDTVIKGLEKWFETGLFSEKLPFNNGPSKVDSLVPNVFQGGHVKFAGTYEPVGIMDYSGFAVDCQTWGMGTLIPYMGNDWVNTHLGHDGAYQLWQQVKNRAGHYINGTFAGVGFTQVLNETCLNSTIAAGGDNNTCTLHEVWSGEWSFGAALMAKTVANTYPSSDPKHKELMTDAANIRKFVMTPVEQGGLNNSAVDGGVLYANMRFFIPWGWYANAVSSLCSTGWSVMEEHDYNPFVLGGGNVLNATVKVKEFATGKSEGRYFEDLQM
jgi:hypothetical protein